MKNLSKKLGFTLIELLVVITIIGILATGAVTVYTGQIQKARDSTRINDVKALQSGIEQVYQDESEYPKSSEFVGLIDAYIKKLPKDPKHSEPCNDGGTPANAPDCAYAYNASNDTNGIALGDYEVSTSFENEANVTKKAATDGGGSTTVDLARLELGPDLTNDTAVAKEAVTDQSGACNLAGGTVTTDTGIIIIAGNPATTGNECG